MSIGFVSFVCAVITTLVAWGAFKVGVYVGRDQEYVRRTSRVLMALRTIRDWAAPGQPSSMKSTHALADQTIKRYACEIHDASL